MGWNDHFPEGFPAGVELFEQVEGYIAEYGTLPLTDWEKAFVVSVREQLEAGRDELTEAQMRTVDELWEKMVSYSCVADD